MLIEPASVQEELFCQQLLKRPTRSEASFCLHAFRQFLPVVWIVDALFHQSAGFFYDIMTSLKLTGLFLKITHTTKKENTVFPSTAR